MLQSLDSWVFYVYLVGLRCLKRLGLKAAKKDATEFQKRWIDRHLRILLMALVEFQKAQCFFVLPVQATALAALSTHASMLPPTTSYQQQLTNQLFHLIGSSGMLPVMLILFALHGAGQKSWYVLGMSTIAVALSGATMLTAEQRSMFEPDNRYSDCGFQDPSAFCIGSPPFTVDGFYSLYDFYSSYDLYFFNLPGGIFSMMAFVFVVLAILTLDFLWNPDKPALIPIRDLAYSLYRSTEARTCNAARAS